LFACFPLSTLAARFARGSKLILRKNQSLSSRPQKSKHEF
jgi:hypothetical protein